MCARMQTLPFPRPFVERKAESWMDCVLAYGPYLQFQSGISLQQNSDGFSAIGSSCKHERLKCAQMSVLHSRCPIQSVNASPGPPER